MNLPIARALFLDAYYQVLDNRVFRLLAIVASLLVLPTFFLGAREQGLVILYGVKTVPWDDIAWLVGGLHNHELIVQRYQEFVVGGLAGTIGILFAIAATAFFVPRMLEKGAADVVFSRPVARHVLLLARYMAGVLFVAILSAVLVFGMHIGLLLVSGTSDPAFLWSILTIVYVFTLVHSVSLLMGVLTRSSVAAILMTILFFTFNGCIQTSWIGSEFFREQARIEQEDKANDPGATKDELGGVPQFLFNVLDTLHFVLPKTTDADLITYKLRKAISEGPPLVRDEAVGLSVVASPRGLQPAGGQGKVDLSQQTARWTPLPDAAEGRAEISLRREARMKDGKRRSARTAARNLSAELQQAGAKVATQTEVRFGPGLHPETVNWTETLPDGTWSRSTGFLSSGDWLYVLEARTPGENTTASGPALTVMALVHEFRIDDNDQDPSKWYERKLDWTAPLRHNIFFSIGSSLLFVLVLFALAAWKLKRIDF